MKQTMVAKMSVQDIIDRGDPIEGVRVHCIGFFNVFNGSVSHQDEDGLIVAEGNDIFGNITVKSPACNFQVVDS